MQCEEYRRKRWSKQTLNNSGHFAPLLKFLYQIRCKICLNLLSLMKSLGHIRKKNSPNFLIYLVLAFLIIFSFLKFSLLKNIVKVKKGFAVHIFVFFLA